MDDRDVWIYFDGPEPPVIRELLDALRDVPAPTEEEKEAVSRRVLERIEAERSRREVGAGAGAGEERGDFPAGVGLERVGEERRGGEEGATARSPVMAAGWSVGARGEGERGDARGERGARAAAAVVVIAGDGAVPAEAKAPAILAATADVVEIPEEYRRRGVLPFKEEAPGRPKAARTLQAEVMSRGLGETAEPDRKVIAEGIAAMRFMGNTVGTGTVPFPRLTVKQYASLQVDLAEATPEQVEGILRKYDVLHESARVALDAHWKKQFAEQPGVREAFEAGWAEYASWLRRVRR